MNQNETEIPKHPAPPIKWTGGEADWAYRKWRATCGPHSIGAALGLHLEDVRTHIPNYRGWMSPTMVTATLNSIGTRFQLINGLETPALCNGINRLQWEGDWLEPGRPVAEAYRHTHYIAHFDGWVLCTTLLAWEWVEASKWRAHLLSRNFRWHVTHWWKVGVPT